MTETGTLELNYVDGDYINETNVYPGWTANKTIVVSNIGTLDAYYKIFWKELTNGITNNELVLSATCTSYENYGGENQIQSGECQSIEETPVSNVAGSIKESIGIESGYTHVYYITFKFKEVSSEQNYNQGKVFAGKINIDESIGSYTMNGTFLDNEGNPLGNTLITLSESISATTDNDGKFVFENVSEGNYTLTVGEVSSNLTLETVNTVGSEGTTITSNVENKDIDLTIKLETDTITYEVTTSNYDVKVLALYVDGVKVASLDNSLHYDLISSSCTNGEDVTWVDATKSITITPITSSTKCTANFNSRILKT